MASSINKYSGLCVRCHAALRPGDGRIIRGVLLCAKPECNQPLSQPPRHRVTPAFDPGSSVAAQRKRLNGP